MKKLIIVESPAKCKKIEEFVGKDYTCVASYGHLTTLPDLKSINIEQNFKPTYCEIPEKKKIITQLKKCISKSSEVILASDDDREGEAIAWHLCQLFKLDVKHTKRIIFHEISKSAVIHALENPGVIDMCKVYSQQSRQILDVLVGYKFSSLLWRHICPATKDGLSAGRCQTPALRLIYDNAREVYENPGEYTNNVFGYFTKHNIKFQLNTSFDGDDVLAAFLKKTVDHKHVLHLGEEAEHTSMAPDPLCTSMLQRASNSMYNMTPKETMRHAQQLYEGGFITYMRTDSKYYSSEFCSKCASFIEEHYTKKYIGAITKIVTEDNTAHEAIRPTDVSLTSTLFNNTDLDIKTKRIYEFIWKTTVQSLMSPCVKKHLVVSIYAPNDFAYTYQAIKIVFDGWKVLEKKEVSLYDYVRLLKDNTVIQYNKITTEPTIKKKKSHLTYGGLIKSLEDRGIGRPSTYASLVEKLLTRKYVSVGNVQAPSKQCTRYTLSDGKLQQDSKLLELGNEKNKLVIQPLGFLVIRFLIKNYPSIFDYGYTSNMETELDNICKNKAIWHEVCMKQNISIDDSIMNACLAESYKDRLAVDDKHDILVAKYGVVVMEKDTKTFHKLRTGICLFRLINMEYRVDELIEECESPGYVGEFESEKVYIKHGKYGKYLAWGQQTKSLSDFSGDIAKLDDVVLFIKSSKQTQSSIRQLTPDMSLRNGKHGDYIYYKTGIMKKPKFLSVKSFDGDIQNAQTSDIVTWLKTTYKI